MIVGLFASGGGAPLPKRKRREGEAVHRPGRHRSFRPRWPYPTFPIALPNPEVRGPPKGYSSPSWVILPTSVKYLMTGCANRYNEFILPKRWGSIMTSELQNSDIGTQRTRRNIMKMGAIAVPATFATIHSAAAGDCLISLGKVCLFPPGGTVGGGGSSSGGGGGHCFLKGTKILAAEGEGN